MTNPAFPDTLKLSSLQKEMQDWRKRNFPDSGADHHLMGVVEEVGELAHCHLKEQQGIRGSALEHQLNAQDAVGDIVIYLMGYCSDRGWNFEGILSTTWERVKHRDWLKNKEDGGDASSPVQDSD